MKMIISTILILAVSSTFASSDRRDKVQKAKKQFERLSAVEAFRSSSFDKKIGTIGLPGTSTWVRGSTLCTKNGKITTRTPSYTQVCVEWSYRNSDGDRVYTTNASTARRKDGRCTSKVNGAKLEAPLSFKKEVTIWGAKRSGELRTEIGGKPRVYRSYSDANDAGSPVKLGTKVVQVNVPTTYNVDFFRKTAGNGRRERENFLGKHKFSVGSCQ